MGDFRHNPEIVGYEHHGGMVFFLQLTDQGKNLLLGGNVQGRGRLVGDQELGIQDQGHGDDNALPLPAGQLMRVGVVDLFHIR